MKRAPSERVLRGSCQQNMLICYAPNLPHASRVLLEDLSQRSVDKESSPLLSSPKVFTPGAAAASPGKPVSDENEERFVHRAYQWPGCTVAQALEPTCS